VFSPPPEIRSGDTWADVDVRLDWPAFVSLGARAESLLDGGPSAEAGLVSTEVLVRCAPEACRGADGGDPRCVAVARLRGLKAATRYLLRASAMDDEDNRAVAEARFETLGAAPRAIVAEVMASPPLPKPRSDGEFIEVLNAGEGPLDLAHFALAGPDDLPRRLVGTPGSAPSRLGPGERALAVGKAFDAHRYSLPPGLLVVRAETQKLLGRGLPDQPPALRLLWLPPPDGAEGSPDGGAPLEIDRYPGGGPRCRQGASLEREPSDGGDPSFRCGADGGSPGVAG
jgi:hypothetical protein